MEFDHEATLREGIARAWGDADRAAELAALAGVPADRASVAPMLASLTNSYVNSRIAELAKDNPPPRDLPADDLWANWRADDGWTGGDYNALLAKGEGQPPNDTLLLVYDILAAWWEGLPPPVGSKRRSAWRPEFERDAAVGQTLAANVPGEVFLFVARRCLHRGYNAANCNAIASRAKDRRRSPEAQERRRQNAAARAVRHRERWSNPPSS